MNSAASSNRNEVSLSFGLSRSLIGHALILLLTLGKSYFFPVQITPYVPVLKVDLVDLPDILKKNQTTPTLSKQNQEISKILKQAELHAARLKTAPPAAKDEMVIDPKKASPSRTNVQDRNRRAMDRIKALAKVQEAALTSSKDKSTPPVLQKGNQLSAGTSISEDAKEAAHANYLDMIRDVLHENFILPAWIEKQNLNARVFIRIDTQGTLREFKIVQSSENSQFDQAVKRAVQQSQPFPPPPPELESEIMSSGILLGFPL